MRWRPLIRKRKVAEEPEAARPEVVILIHGTGAADADPVNPKWWETASQYAQDLRARLGPRFDVGETDESAPFKWSGANSEKDRRGAGRKLAKRLSRLERDGRKYHLVGHSHGGSVIWHALWQSKGRLDGLRSWTSVGTPFLEFSPVWTGITTLLALAIVAALAYAPALQLFTAAAERNVIVRDANTLGLVTTITLCALLLFFLLGLALAAIRWLIRHLLLWRQQRRERRAVETFADRWLAIWHGEDEPIAGLNASLISPLEFVPRLGKPSSNVVWRVLNWPFNRVIAPVVDQFVWVILMRRLQGADIGGSVMVDAGSAPGPLAPGWQSMPKDLAADMVMSAGNQAPRTIEGLRKRLAEMRGRGSGQEAFGHLSSAVTWSEILHTSYFDIQSVRGLIADRIEQSASAPETTDTFKSSPHFNWLAERPKLPPPQWPKPFQPVLLNFAKIAVFGGLALLLFIGFRAAYDAYVAPHTLDGQLNILAQNATTREEMSGGKVGLLGDILVRLDLLGKLGNPIPILRRIPDPNTRAWAQQRLAYHYGFNGDFTSIVELASDATTLELANPADAVAFVYVHALMGAYDARQSTKPPQPPAAFLDVAARKLVIAGYTPEDVQAVHVFDPRQDYNYVWIVPVLEALTHFKHQPSIDAAKSRIDQVLNSTWLKPEEYAKALDSKQFMTCEVVGILTQRFDQQTMPPNLQAAYIYCSTPKPISSKAVPPAATPGAPSAPCPTEAELDTPSPRVGELHFTWKESVARIYDLIKRKCNDAAVAALRRHIPEPVGEYESAALGTQLNLVAGWLSHTHPDAALEIAKYNLKWSPMAVAGLTIKEGGQVINRRLCFDKCSREELLAIAEGYREQASLPEAPDGMKKVDFTRYRVVDRAYYRLASALIHLDLGERRTAKIRLRLALFALTFLQTVPVNDRHHLAFKIGLHAYPIDHDLGLEAFAAASNYVYGISQSGATAAAASGLHMQLAAHYFDVGEYRLARESAEKARDRLSVIASQSESLSDDLEDIGLGDGRAVLLVYKTILDKAIRSTRAELADQPKRGPKLHELQPRT